MNKSFVVATILSAILVFGGSLLAPVEVRFIESITGSTTISGLVFGGASVMLIFLSYVLARVSSNIGRHRTILLGTVFGLVYALLYASVVNTLGAFGVKFGWAIAVAATNPILAAYMQSTLVSNPNKGRYFGYYYSVASIAGSSGALLGGYVFESLGFTYVAYALAGTYIAAFLVALFLPKQEQNNNKSSSGDTVNHSVFSLLRLLFKKPELRFYLASNVSTAMNWGVKPFLWPLVIFTLSGSDTVTGSIFATMGVVAFVLLPFAGMVADKVGPYRVIVLELLLFSIAGISMAFTGSVLVFWIAAAFYTVGEIFNLAQAMILTEELDEDIRGEAMALDTAFDQILGFSSPLIAGVLVTMYSPSIALACFMLLYVLSFLVTGWLAVKYDLFSRI